MPRARMARRDVLVLCYHGASVHLPQPRRPRQALQPRSSPWRLAEPVSHGSRVVRWPSSVSTSAARSRTPCCSTAGGSSPRRSRPSRSRSRPCSPQPPRSAPEASSASRTGRRSRRTRCSSARARGRRSSAQQGFEHLLHLRRQTRAHLYRLCAEHSGAARPARALVGVRERIGPDGVLEPLDLDTLPEVDAEAVAVCTLFSFRDPSHELAVAAELRRRLPDATSSPRTR